MCLPVKEAVGGSLMAVGRLFMKVSSLMAPQKGFYTKLETP